MYLAGSTFDFKLVSVTHADWNHPDWLGNAHVEAKFEATLLTQHQDLKIAFFAQARDAAIIRDSAHKPTTWRAFVDQILAVYVEGVELELCYPDIEEYRRILNHHCGWEAELKKRELTEIWAETINKNWKLSDNLAYKNRYFHYAKKFRLKDKN